MKPAISVMTIVHNGEKHIRQCLESVASQTFQDYEHVIVDDASTDSTPEILREWSGRDSRIRVLTNQENRGRPLSRNRALTAATAPLVAVLDADDYSLPERLELQYRFLEEHPDAHVLGGAMGIHGSSEILRHPASNGAIRADLFFDSSFFHSTVMMRKDALAGMWYDQSLPLAQDYGLWASLMFRPDYGFANLEATLSVYRLPEKPRPGYAEKQFGYANAVRARILKQIGLAPNQASMRCHLALLYQNAAATGTSPADCAAWGKKLAEANARNPLAEPAELEKQIQGRLEMIFARDLAQRRAGE